MSSVVSDYLNLCQLTEDDQQRLVGMAEAILMHHTNHWPLHSGDHDDLDL